MDKDKLAKIIYGLKIANTVVENGNKVDANVILSALFDRRQSSIDSYQSSFDPIVHLNQSDFESLKNRKICHFYSSKNTLTGYYYEVPNPKGIVIYVHGLGSLADDWYAIGQDYFVRHGFNVFAIDLTCCGRSEGFGVKGLAQSALDVVAAIRYVRDSIDRKSPLFLFGHSWGGYGVAASMYFEDVNAVASLSGFSSPIDEMLGVPSSFVEDFGVELPANLLNKEELIAAAKNRWPEYYDLSAIDAINSSNVPILIVQGGKDKIVTMDGSSIYSKKDKIRTNNVEYILLPDRDHLNLFRSKDSARYDASVKSLRKDLEKTYGKNISKVPNNVLEDFRKSFNRDMTSQVNENLFDTIVNFFEIHSK